MQKTFIIIGIFLACLVIPAHATADPPKAAILVSLKIKPYIEALEGINAVLSDGDRVDMAVFYMEAKQSEAAAKEALNDLAQRLKKEAFDIFLGIGPEAIGFLATEFGNANIPIIYCMVLEPAKLIAPAATVCGISLSIPAHEQLDKIHEHLLPLKRIGILYDPKHNARFVTDTVQYSDPGTLTVVPLTVTSKKDIPVVLRQNWSRIDGLWLIPDQTVIEEKIIEYITKEAIYHKKPVIGYNRFFYETGAFMAFVRDYHKIGRQTAGIVLQVVAGEPCRDEIPAFDIWINKSVKTLLGLDKIEGKETGGN